MNHKKLRQLVSSIASYDDLQTVVFDLGWSSIADDWPTNASKNLYIVYLLRYCGDNNACNALVNELCEMRPMVCDDLIAALQEPAAVTDMTQKRQVITIDIGHMVANSTLAYALRGMVAETLGVSMADVKIKIANGKATANAPATSSQVAAAIFEIETDFELQAVSGGTIDQKQQTAVHPLIIVLAVSLLAILLAAGSWLLPDDNGSEPVVTLMSTNTIDEILPPVETVVNSPVDSRPLLPVAPVPPTAVVAATDEAVEEETAEPTVNSVATTAVIEPTPTKTAAVPSATSTSRPLQTETAVSFSPTKSAPTAVPATPLPTATATPTIVSTSTTTPTATLLPATMPPTAVPATPTKPQPTVTPLPPTSTPTPPTTLTPVPSKTPTPPTTTTPPATQTAVSSPTALPPPLPTATPNDYPPPVTLVPPSPYPVATSTPPATQTAVPTATPKPTQTRKPKPTHPPTPIKPTARPSDGDEI